MTRIALDVGTDSVYFDNPDLPETRSEMAMPLRAGRRVNGVLDVQSREPNAFSKDDIEVLEILADQIAIAIENTRLLPRQGTPCRNQGQPSRNTSGRNGPSLEI